MNRVIHFEIAPKDPDGIPFGMIQLDENAK